MRQIRLREQTDGTVHINEVHKNPSGLSTAKDQEVTLLVLTKEEMEDAEKVGPLDPPVIDAPVEHPGSGLSIDKAIAVPEAVGEPVVEPATEPSAAVVPEPSVETKA